MDTCSNPSRAPNTTHRCEDGVQRARQVDVGKGDALRHEEGAVLQYVVKGLQLGLELGKGITLGLRTNTTRGCEGADLVSDHSVRVVVRTAARCSAERGKSRSLVNTRTTVLRSVWQYSSHCETCVSS